MIDRKDLFFGMEDESRFPPDFDWEFLKKIAGVRGRLDHAYYLFRYARLIPINGRIVEVGTLEGGSAIAMGMAVRKTEAQIITIDPGLMSLPEKNIRRNELKLFAEYQANGDIHNVLHNIRNAGLEAYISIIPDTSEAALRRWDGRRIDLLYVDGDHTYDAVKIDCGWMPYVAPGGIAVFDDWIEPVERAVREYIKDWPEWELLTSSTDQPPGKPWKTVLWKKHLAAAVQMQEKG